MMLEESELTALAAQRRGIWGRRHTEEHEGKTVRAVRWGTERTYIETSEDDPHIYLSLHERNVNGELLKPYLLLLTLEDLIELDLVLSVYLDGYAREQLGIQEVGG
jgi:hypothetical protein